MKNKILRFSILISSVTLIVFILIKPEICKDSAIRGVLISGKIIVPSLFPFMALLLFLMNYLGNYIKRLDFITKPLFMLSGEMVCITLFSFLGGYPVGVKLLNETVTDEKSRKRAFIATNFCVNAGPAFIISAIGIGLLGSKLLGIILLLSHILASVILILINRKGLRECINYESQPKPKNNMIDAFVNSVANASASTLSICSYIILFSVISAYIDYLSDYFSYLKYMIYILEVTTAVTKTKNIYLISFLLGFSGLSVWCQILSSSKNIKINVFSFSVFRILHGIISSVITYVIVKTFKISIPILSNNVSFDFKALYSNAPVSISLLIMVILLIISLFTKKDTGKIFEDVV